MEEALGVELPLGALTLLVPGKLAEVEEPLGVETADSDVDEPDAVDEPESEEPVPAFKQLVSADGRNETCVH